MENVRNIVNEWYGMENMPIRIQTREEEITEFEKLHTEIPPCMWDYVNHTMRHVLMWSKSDLCVDLVVQYEGELRLIQDIVFKDAYSSASEWHQAVYAFLAMNKDKSVWIVTHLD